MLDFLNPVKGFGVTFTEMFRKVETVSYPEDKRPTAPRFHGHHQLNRWPDGLEKCIGCELCAWACPADAIYVEGRDNSAGGRFSPGERYGAVYQINYLRCILCGMCIEACPTRALTMTNEYEIADDSRENLIWTKEQLLAPLQAGMEAPPHPMRLGDDEKDYYRLARGPMKVMPDLKPEVTYAAPAAEDARIGLALLQLLAQAADSQPQAHWVHRRIAQLEFLDTRAVRWRISVDFTVPESAPHADGSPLLVPITRWQKSELVKVDFRDEQGAAIPLMTAEVTSRFMAAALYRWAAGILQPAGLPPPELGRIFAELTKIVSQVPDPVMQKKPADDRIDALLERISDGNSRVSGALFADKEFLSRLFELSENFVVLALVDSPPGTRRIIKLAFESRVTFQQPHGRWRTIRQYMGWRDWRLEVLLGGRGGSGHLEVAAPPGVDIYKIVARPAVPRPDPAAQGPGNAAGGTVRFVADGGKPHVGIRIPAGARRYRVIIYLRVSRVGWLASSWLVAVVIVGSMVAGWTKLGVLFPPGPPTEAGTAATLLLALLGVFATYLIRPGEHPLAARLLRAGRGLIILDAGVLLIAVGDLLLHSSKHLPERIWGILTCFSGVLALLLTVSLLLPWPWKKVTAHEAPHRESDVRPSGAGDVAPDPEGVTLQAPDGFSYGDQHYWGGDNQRELVHKLADVRRAAGFLPGQDAL